LRPLIERATAAPTTSFRTRASLSERNRQAAWATSFFLDPLARVVVRTAVARATRGALSLVEDNRPEPGVSADPGSLTVFVRHARAYRSVLFGGSVGLGRSYVAGDWDCEDLVGLIRLATRALPPPDSLLGRLGGLIGRLRGEHSGSQAEDQARDRADIQAHYDLGDDFFSLFLDPTLTYSCGIFESPADSMEQASINKLERICQKLELGPGDEVLEVGTGWGSFALHAAGRYGCRITTTTISEHQYATAARRVAEAGLDHLVTVLDRDYRDLEASYDKLVSIEMIEAIGWRQQDRFFEHLAHLLAPGGTFVLQAIVIDDRLYEKAKRQEDLIKALVFPGSSIPSVASITASATRAGLLVEHKEEIGHHYAETLSRWRARFLDNRDEIAALGYEPALLRLWDLYLSYCQAGFEEGRIGDVQFVLARPARPDGTEGRSQGG
jgi:cyclopropane-fatty-acyl-phospholipid synthase